MKRTLYFAYGSNLHVEQLQRRCPGARREGAATLPGWQLAFRGVADVEPRPGRAVQGGLWSITQADLAALDRYEGFPSLYDRRKVRVVSPTLGDVEAIVYTMVRQDSLMLPSQGYLRTIADGYRDFGLRHRDLLAAVRRAGRDLKERGVRELVVDGKRCRTVPKRATVTSITARQRVTAGMSPATISDLGLDG